MNPEKKYIASFSVKSIIANPYGWQTFALIVVHQTIIASAAFFLTRLIESFQQGRPYLNYLLFYFAAMTIPFIPGCLSYLTLTKWQNLAHQRYIAAASEAANKKLALYKNTVLRNEFAGVVSRNSFFIVSLFCEYLHSSLTFLLNSFLSILVIGLILPSHLALGYIISASISMMVVVAASPVISRKSVVLEKSNIAYGADLSKIWANTTVGNAYNKKLWEGSIDKSGKEYYGRSFELSLSRQSINFLLGMIALLPTMYLIYEAATDADIAPPVIAAIVVNLTRIVHILNSFGELIHQAIDLKSVFSRLGLLQSVLRNLMLEDGSLPSRPNGSVLLNGSSIQNFDEVIVAIEGNPAGRHTVTGANGSGKSTLLTYLKNNYGDRCLLLPANATDFTWKTMEGKASTGQTLLAIINEVVDESAAEIFLLDEWDANLDSHNRRAIDARLNLLAQKCIVVEVRHRDVV